jgi:FkbM family methyltransferase
MKLSYAQAMEDYHLRLAFDGEPRGFYIDVGGGHPVADNVTFDLYLRGWRGLVVEPQENLAATYVVVRPRDTVETCLVGLADGEAAFHQVEGLHGLSGMTAESAERGTAFGAAVTTLSRPVRTLATLARRHGIGRIDLLKVDVEGAEAAVLGGIDWPALAPRLVVVEAVRAGDMAPSHGEWEPALLARGYRMALFDGLNRWYVAADADRLGSRLPACQSPWDAVMHLWDCGRAAEQAMHPDHALARLLAGHGVADHGALTSGDAPARVARLIGGLSLFPEIVDRKAETDIVTLLCGDRATLGFLPDVPAVAGLPLADALARLLASDGPRAALGRIAARHDGGFID